MATDVEGILRTLIPTTKNDLVAIYDENYSRVFEEAKIMDLRVRQEARVMEHPVENGSVITDHRILLPIEVDITLTLNEADYQNLYSSIRQYYVDSSYLIVQTKAGTYENLIIAAMPHVEISEMYSAIELLLNLKQVQLVSAQTNVNPANQSNSSTVQRGTQQGSSANATQESKATTGLMNLKK